MGGREQVEYIEDSQTVESLSRSPEQRDYELLRPIAVFGYSPASRVNL